MQPSFGSLSFLFANAVTTLSLGGNPPADLGKTIQLLSFMFPWWLQHPQLLPKQQTGRNQEGTFTPLVITGVIMSSIKPVLVQPPVQSALAEY